MLLKGNLSLKDEFLYFFLGPSGWEGNQQEEHLISIWLHYITTWF